MDEDEDNERRRGEEMDRACRLPSAEQLEQPRGRRRSCPATSSGRSGSSTAQAGRRRRNRRASATRCRAASSPSGKRSTGAAIGRSGANRCRSAEGHARNARRHGRDEIDDSYDHEQPCEEEVPSPARREILIARERRPRRKASRLAPVALRRRATRSYSTPGRRACVSPTGSSPWPPRRHREHGCFEV